MQGENAEQALFGVDHIDIIYRFGFLGDTPQEHDGVVGTHVRGDGDERRGHAAAGGIGRIGGELPNLGGFIRLHRLAEICSRSSEGSSAMMSVASSGSIASRRSAASSRERRRRIAAAFAGSSSSRISGISSSGIDSRRTATSSSSSRSDDVGPVGRSEAVSQTPDTELFALGDQVTDFIEQLVRGHGRAKPREGRLRICS